MLCPYLAPSPLIFGTNTAGSAWAVTNNVEVTWTSYIKATNQEPALHPPLQLAAIAWDLNRAVSQRPTLDVIIMASPTSPGPASGRSPGPLRGQRGASGRDASSPGPTTATSIPHTLWSLQVPLHITHSAPSARPPFIVSAPRLSYLALLLPRLTAYFGAACSSFHHEEVQLRNLPLGLLADLYQPEALPWRLVVGDGPEWDIGDTFLNGAKEADFVRNNNAQQIMSLSKADTTALWNAVQDSECPPSVIGLVWTLIAIACDHCE